MVMTSQHIAHLGEKQNWHRDRFKSQQVITIIDSGIAAEKS